MKYLCAVVGISLLTASALAQQRTRVIGLLALPEVFGNGPCDRFTPREVPLHDALESARVVGVIRVEEPWKVSSDGGCEGLRVGVHMTGTTASDPLPTKEYGYEGPGAIVSRGEARSSQPSVRVIRSQQFRGELWFDVEVTTSPCSEDPNVKTLDRGWVPAHTTSGEPVMWFSSRGC